MQRFIACITLCALGISVAISSLASSGPSPEAQAPIDELGLEAAQTPISKHPGWHPQRMAVSLIPAMGSGSHEYKAQLQKPAVAAAGVMAQRSASQTRPQRISNMVCLGKIHSYFNG